jgi:hypothetical protein
MWTDLVKAYESNIAVLEESRRAYEGAMKEVVSEAGQAMERATREGIGKFGGGLSQTFNGVSISEDAVFPKAPCPYVSIIDEAGTTEFRLTIWVASAFGGPQGLLRLGVALQRLRPGLNLKAWIAKCSESMPDAAPGEPFDPLDAPTFSDMASDEPLFRVVSIPLTDQETRDVAREVHDATLALTGYITQLFEPITDAGHPMEVVEDALLSYRPTLEALAAEAGVSVSPSKGLGPWGSGGRYLQVGNFWLASLPSMNGLVACANKADRDVLAGLAKRLDRPVGRDSIVVVLTEEELRDPEADCEASISEAFELWFVTKATEREPGPDSGEAAE